MEVMANEVLESNELVTLGFRACEDVNILAAVFVHESPFVLVVSDFNKEHHIFEQIAAETFSYKKSYKQMLEEVDCCHQHS